MGVYQAWVTLFGVVGIIGLLLSLLCEYLGGWTQTKAWLTSSKEEKMALTRPTTKRYDPNGYMVPSDSDLNLSERGSFRHFDKADCDYQFIRQGSNTSLTRKLATQIPPQPLRPAPIPPQASQDSFDSPIPKIAPPPDSIYVVGRGGSPPAELANGITNNGHHSDLSATNPFLPFVTPKSNNHHQGPTIAENELMKNVSNLPPNCPTMGELIFSAAPSSTVPCQKTESYYDWQKNPPISTQVERSTNGINENFSTDSYRYTQPRRFSENCTTMYENSVRLKPMSSDDCVVGTDKKEIFSNEPISDPLMQSKRSFDMGKINSVMSDIRNVSVTKTEPLMVKDTFNQNHETVSTAEQENMKILETMREEIRRANEQMTDATKSLMMDGDDVFAQKKKSEDVGKLESPYSRSRKNWASNGHSSVDGTSKSMDTPSTTYRFQPRSGYGSLGASTKPTLNSTKGSHSLDFDLAGSKGREIIMKLLKSSPLPHVSSPKMMDHRRSSSTDGGNGVTSRNLRSFSLRESSIDSVNLDELSSPTENGNLQRAMSCDSVCSDTSVILGDLDSPNVTGYLCIGLEYDSETADLLVNVIEGKEFLGPTLNLPFDSYVRVYLMPDKTTNMQTRVYRKSLNPVYKEKFMFGLEPNELGSRSLIFYTYATDKYSNTLIGEGELKLSELDLSEATTTWLPLTDTGSKCGEYGEIMFSLSYLPTAERLTVVVVKARNLNFTHNKETGDPFVKVYLLQKGKKVSKKKSSTKKGERNPIFNEAMIFSVPAHALQTIHLRITVADSGEAEKGRACSIGHVIVGSGATGKPLSHWNQMLSSLRKPQCMWHSLRK